MTPVASAAIKIAVPAVVIGIVLFRTRNIPRDELGFSRAPLSLSLIFVIAFLGWMLVSDAMLHWRGPWDWRPWTQAPFAASAMRVIAVTLLGPIAEELVFRGWFFGLLEKRLGTALAIVSTAVGWAALHYTYTWAVILVIVVDGLLLGTARARTRSVYVPMAMHALYNLYAVW